MERFFYVSTYYRLDVLFSIYQGARFISHAGVRQETRSACYRRSESRTHRNQTKNVAKASKKSCSFEVARQQGRNRQRRHKPRSSMSHDDDDTRTNQGGLSVPYQRAQHENDYKKMGVRVVHALFLTRDMSLGGGITSGATSFGGRANTLMTKTEGAITNVWEVLQHLGCGRLHGWLLVRSVCSMGKPIFTGVVGTAAKKQIKSTIRKIIVDNAIPRGDKMNPDEGEVVKVRVHQE